jgi:voltage-gated potassium channel
MNYEKYIFRTLVYLSVALYFIEVSFTGSSNSLGSPMEFLWAERFIALVFTCEILYRYRTECQYINSFLFWVDVISVAPFWLGFVVPVEYLGWIRTLRVLRLGKLVRYNKSLQKLLRATMIALPSLRGALFCMFTVCLFATAIIFQVEHAAQPDVFTTVWDCFYYCTTTATTTGFGDLYPITLIGRILTMCLLYGPAIATTGIIFGIMSDAYTKAGDE